MAVISNSRYYTIVREGRWKENSRQGCFEEIRAIISDIALMSELPKPTKKKIVKIKNYS